MKTHYHIIIAGAGGIAEAAALMLAELSELTPDIYVGNRHLEKAEKLVQWVQAGTTRPCTIQAFHLTEDVNPDMEQILRKGDILLDKLADKLPVIKVPKTDILPNEIDTPGENDPKTDEKKD